LIRLTASRDQKLNAKRQKINTRRYKSDRKRKQAARKPKNQKTEKQNQNQIAGRQQTSTRRRSSSLPFRPKLAHAELVFGPQKKKHEGSQNASRNQKKKNNENESQTIRIQSKRKTYNKHGYFWGTHVAIGSRRKLLVKIEALNCTRSTDGLCTRIRIEKI